VQAPPGVPRGGLLSSKVWNGRHGGEDLAIGIACFITPPPLTGDQTHTHTHTHTLFEDLFEAITIHKDFCGEKLDPQPSISLLNKTNTLNGYDFTINIFEDDFNSLLKKSLMLFEAHCVFGYREFYKNLLCILMEVNKTMYGNNECVPDKLLDIFLLSIPGIRNHMNQ
jgi:hypothetical protein